MNFLLCLTVFNYSCHRNFELFCHLYYTLLEKLHEMNVARSRIGQQRVALKDFVLKDKYRKFITCYYVDTRVNN